MSAHFGITLLECSHETPRYLWAKCFCFSEAISRAWDSQKAVLALKTETKKLFSCSTAFSSRPLFSLVSLLLLTYLKKPFLLSLISLTRFNSKPSPSHPWCPDNLPVFLPWAQTPFPRSNYFFFHLSFSMSSLLIHVGLLPPLPDLLLFGVHQSWAWKWCLSVNQISCAPYLPVLSPMDVPFQDKHWF